MKRRVWLLFAAVLIMLAFPLPVRADAGPKPSIQIYCVNLPEGEIYLDLLIDRPQENASFHFDTTSLDKDRTVYNKEMLDILKAYNVDGWRPALTTGTGMPLWGELRLGVADGIATAKFSYMGVPNRFKVIVVTQDCAVVVSNTVEKKMFQSVVNFDYATGTASERSPAAQAAKQFAFTLAATFIIEGLALLLFRFSLRSNWRPFVFINLGTQVVLNTLIILTYLNFGTGIAVIAYILCELIVFIAETMLFVSLLKQHSKLRRALFAITANLISFGAGLLLTTISML